MFGTNTKIDLVLSAMCFVLFVMLMLTHAYKTIVADKLVLFAVGVFMPPIGLAHGIAIWFGFSAL